MVEGWLKIRDLVVNYYSDSWVGWFTILIVEHSDIVGWFTILIYVCRSLRLSLVGEHDSGKRVATRWTAHWHYQISAFENLHRRIWSFVILRFSSQISSHGPHGPKVSPKLPIQSRVSWHMLAQFEPRPRWGMDPPTEKARESTCSAGNPWEPWDVAPW